MACPARALFLLFLPSFSHRLFCDILCHDHILGFKIFSSLVFLSFINASCLFTESRPQLTRRKFPRVFIFLSLAPIFSCSLFSESLLNLGAGFCFGFPNVAVRGVPPVASLAVPPLVDIPCSWKTSFSWEDRTFSLLLLLLCLTTSSTFSLLASLVQLCSCPRPQGP